MKLTRKAEYGIRAVLYISSHSEKEKVLTREIAENMGIPKQFLAQVMLVLSNAGIVRAIRGANGGFKLAKKASEIDLKEVIESIEGPIALNECLLNQGQCDNKDDCPEHDVWEEAQESMLSVLDKADFAWLSKSMLSKKAALAKKVALK